LDRIIRAVAAAALMAGLLAAGCGKKTASATHSPTTDESGIESIAPITDAVSPTANRTFTDNRDSQTYKTVTIGEQTWMAQNLNYKTKHGAWCYDNNADNCKEYGRLYDWKTAKTVCPAGWKLPDTADWYKLIRSVGGKEIAGKKLKSKNGWINRDDASSGNGTDDYEFSALPGGQYVTGYFNAANYGNIIWTATTDASSGRFIFVLGMSYSYDYVQFGGGLNEGWGHYVRCVADSP